VTSQYAYVYSYIFSIITKHFFMTETRAGCTAPCPGVIVSGRRKSRLNSGSWAVVVYLNHIKKNIVHIFIFINIYFLYHKTRDVSSYHVRDILFLFFLLIIIIVYFFLCYSFISATNFESRGFVAKGEVFFLKRCFLYLIWRFHHMLFLI